MRGSAPVSDVSDPEVPERARWRTYTAAYKRDVLAEYEAADRAGKDAVPRREGLYSSWREQRHVIALMFLESPDDGHLHHVPLPQALTELDLDRLPGHENCGSDLWVVE